MDPQFRHFAGRVSDSGEGRWTIKPAIDESVPAPVLISFWAPDVMPAEAMSGCSSTRVGRISHAVFEAREFDRTAAFFERLYGVVRVTGPEIADDTLVLRLGARRASSTSCSRR